MYRFSCSVTVSYEFCNHLWSGSFLWFPCVWEGREERRNKRGSRELLTPTAGWPTLSTVKTCVDLCKSKAEQQQPSSQSARAWGSAGASLSCMSACEGRKASRLLAYLSNKEKQDREHCSRLAVSPFLTAFIPRSANEAATGEKKGAVRFFKILIIISTLITDKVTLLKELTCIEQSKVVHVIKILQTLYIFIIILYTSYTLRLSKSLILTQ